MDFGASEAREGERSSRSLRGDTFVTILYCGDARSRSRKRKSEARSRRDMRAARLRAHAHSSEREARGHECVDRWFDESC